MNIHHDVGPCEIGVRSFDIKPGVWGVERGGDTAWAHLGNLGVWITWRRPLEDRAKDGVVLVADIKPIR